MTEGAAANGVEPGDLTDPAAIEAISDLLADGTRLLWIDVKDPSPEEMQRIGEEFGLHPLAIEDAIHRHERPKLEQYEGYVYIVFYALEMSDGRPTTREINLFVGENYLLTVHEGDLAVIAETADRWTDHLRRHAPPTAGVLAYVVIDAIVDGYFPAIDELAERIEDLEDDIFGGHALDTQREIFRLKKDLLAVRRVVAPERDVMNVLVRRDAPLFTEKEATYFRDVYDHLLRITDIIDTYREVLSGALDANLSMTSYRLNATVKRMTSSSIILMSMALVSGIYGMNFVNMPELGWGLGYLWALVLMAVIGGSLFAFFRRIDWL
ncbi:MAG: magnesium/cobalt transporter CorA [Chloroflexia bacterium]|nr:magnesium/cobalt transporter CorA [Chloroflexia bacterium]